MNARRSNIASLAAVVGLLLSALPAFADKEKEGEFKPLFNDKDLTGWKAIDGPIDSWKAEDGMLSTTGKEGGWLSTEDEYANFELKLEFRVPEGGNSGVFLRAPHKGNPAFAGMEVQVLDDYDEQYADLQPAQYCGSLYGVAAAEPRVSKKAGEWQKLHIVCDGNRVQVELNGEQVVDANLDEHTDKVKEHPGIERKTGYIGLQNHGSPLDYRNILIRKLP
ncbi:MAG: DUF1080 domain-containing protein [Pirellulales bacterium]